MVIDCSQHTEDGTVVSNHVKPLRTNIHINVKGKLFFRLISIHSFKISRGKLLKDQSMFRLNIILFILMASSLDDA